MIGRSRPFLALKSDFLRGKKSFKNMLFGVVVYSSNVVGYTVGLGVLKIFLTRVLRVHYCVISKGGDGVVIKI